MFTAAQKRLLNEGIFDKLGQLLKLAKRAPKQQVDPQKMQQQIKQLQQQAHKIDPTGKITASPEAQAVKQKILSLFGIQESSRSMHNSGVVPATYGWTHMLSSMIQLAAANTFLASGSGVAILCGISAAASAIAAAHFLKKANQPGPYPGDVED